MLSIAHQKHFLESLIRIQLYLKPKAFIWANCRKLSYCYYKKANKILTSTADCVTIRNLYSVNLATDGTMKGTIMKKTYIVTLLALLSATGSSVMAMEETKVNNLIEAVEAGKKEEVEKLLQQGADINQLNKYGLTPLMLAVATKQKDIVKFLIEKEADLNIQQKETDDTALTSAVTRGYTEIAKLLINAPKIDLNKKAVYGETALMRAAHYGHKDIVELLIKKGADLKIKDSTGRTAFIMAAVGGHENIVKLFIQKGEEVKVNQEKLIAMAVAMGHVDMVKFLINEGADLNITDNFGKRALMRAVKMDHKDMVEFLIEKGAKFDQEELIDIATKKGHTEIVKLLKEAHQ